MELGRTIVAPKYQRDILSLKLLLTGIFVTCARTEGAEYLFGPVSMSNAIPPFYKSLIIHYVLKKHAKAGTALVKSLHPCQLDFLRVNPDGLLVRCNTVDDLDRLIVDLS